MSIWDTVKGIHPQNYTHWPNPFPVVTNAQVMACSPNMLVKINYAGNVFANWFFDNFIPSPVELTRKTLTGRYKCGFYLPGVKIPSPLDVIWEDTKPGTLVGEILAPVTTGLFVIWAGQTIFSAIQAYATVMMAFEACYDDPNGAVLSSGSAYFPNDSMQGSPAFFHTVWDPMHVAEPIDGVFNASPGGITAQAFGKVIKSNHPITYFSVAIVIGNTVIAETEVSIPTNSLSASWMVEGQFNATQAGAVRLRVTIIQSGQGAFGTDVQCNRFIFHQGPPIDPISHGALPPLPNPCMAPYQPFYEGLLPSP